MERLCLHQPIQEAIDLLPEGIRRRVENIDWLTGCNPCFVGLHNHEVGLSGFSLTGVAHCNWLVDHQPTTIVLPVPTGIVVVIHELGHVLDEQIEFQRHTPDAVSWYAETNTWEAFAEAFVCWVAPDLAADHWSGYDLDVARSDAETIALFETLAV